MRRLALSLWPVLAAGVLYGAPQALAQVSSPQAAPQQGVVYPAVPPGHPQAPEPNQGMVLEESPSPTSAPAAVPTPKDPSAYPTAAQAEGLVTGLSQSRVGITINFDGSEILVYGAVDRRSPMPDGPLDVIVTVEGPAREVVVRKKERVFGIWVNTSAVEIDRAPEFYAVTGTRALDEILTPEQDRIHRISLPRAVRSLSASRQVAEPESYIEALLRLGRASGAYVTQEHGVSLTRNVLFRTDLALPANLSEGLFLVRVFLMRDGQVVATEASGIEVHKEGIERYLHRLALDQPAIYGILSLFFAIAAGWLASAAFSYLRR